MTNDPIIKKFPYFHTTHSQEYHYVTKLNKFRDKVKGFIVPKEWSQINYKGYPKFKKIKLYKPTVLGSLDKAFFNRKSCRSFSNKALTKKEVSTLLYYMAGAVDIKYSTKRFYPSAGARYPLEVYPIVFNVTGLKKGIYHYHVRSNSLEYMWSDERLIDVVMKNIGMEVFSNASMLIVISAVFGRTERKYGPRGYRHILMEVGHMTQNIYLTSSSLNKGCCSIGGFLDDEINKLLDIDGIIESTLLVIALGNKKGGDSYDER